MPPPDSDQVRRSTRDLAAAKAQQAHAQQGVSSAQSALEATRRLAEQARGLREDAARRTVTRLHEASDAGIHNRHWWEKAVHWVADHWDEIVTVCKWIVAILGIVVMIIGGPLAWLVVAAALVVLADTVMKYIQGKATLWDVLFAALDCIPMTKGLTSLGKLAELYKAGGLLKIGAHAVESARAGLRGVALGIRDFTQGMRYWRLPMVVAVRDLATAGNTPLALTIKGFKDGRPGMKMFRPGDVLMRYMDRIKPVQGTFDVGLHGAPRSVGFQIKNGPAHLAENWHSFDHRQVASLMKANGWNGEPVRLLSCNTGSLADGFAQNLANHLGVPVEAPDNFLWVHPSGKIEGRPVRRHR
ncbi:hypothetical protein [Actinacidiphila acidipaludis]|uniref:Uncharacterized protein n=1 Tax=Actinacidiphila acidipaludis TaxID=2873382 RepID=A0ABS7Q819_9ACTN|nr:hypothetical protein [Streptomyces acidipaludis]MBY8879309.1 hypothetical protein [Streptomyces acidipaludis]